MNKRLILLQALTKALENVQSYVELRMIDFFRGLEIQSVGLTCSLRIYGRTYCMRYLVPVEECHPDKIDIMVESMIYQLENLIEEAL